MGRSCCAPFGRSTAPDPRPSRSPSRPATPSSCGPPGRALVLVPAEPGDAAGGPPARIVVHDPYAALVRVMGALFPPAAPAPGVDRDRPARRPASCWARASASGPSWCSAAASGSGDRCRLAEGVSLGDDVTVGEDTVIGPRAVIYRETSIGSRVVIKAGAVIGGPGSATFPTPAATTGSRTSAAADRRRRGDRLQLLRRPRQRRRHGGRARHQARQPGARRAQRPHRARAAC